MLGHALSSCATHAKHGHILFACNENIAHVMPRVTACAMMSCTHHTVCTQASWPPYVYVPCQELLMDVPFMKAK